MEKSSYVKTGALSAPRREFLRKTGSLTIMTMFGAAFFTGCSTDDVDPDDNSTNPPNAANGITVSSETVTVDLSVATSLAAPGGWALVLDAKLLIVNLGDNNYNALTSVCTHSQCDRNWLFANNIFTCTCHSSRFRTNGTVASGPAVLPLRNYPATLNNQLLTVDLT